MELVRTRYYEAGLKRLAKLGASASDIDKMEAALGADPAAGDVIPGTGGLRKVRFAFGQSGKRGGGRTIYYALTSQGLVYLLAAFAKADKADLTGTEKKLLKAMIKELVDD